MILSASRQLLTLIRFQKVAAGLALLVWETHLEISSRTNYLRCAVFSSISSFLVYQDVQLCKATKAQKIWQIVMDKYSDTKRNVVLHFCSVTISAASREVMQEKVTRESKIQNQKVNKFSHAWDMPFLSLHAAILKNEVNVSSVCFYK